MKPNDEAYQAAIAECKRWGKNLIRKENQIPSWKVLRQSDKQYGYDVIAQFNDHKDRDEALERLRAEAMVDAAYAAQFKSEDYAGLVKDLRAFDEELLNAQPHSCEQTAKQAADALEAVLAERETYKNWLDNYEKQFSAKVEELVTVRLERDALAARLAPVEPIESDKDDPTREYIPLPGGWEIQTKGKGSSYRLLDKKTGERHMILASDVPFIHAFVTRMAKEINASAQVQPVAPVDDDSRHLTTEEQKVFNSALRRSTKIKKPVDYEALVETVARAICLNRASHACNCKEDGACKAPLENLREYNEVWPQARAAIAAAIRSRGSE